MWTSINQLFTTNDSQNAWANLASDNAWHQILSGASDGVTNVFVLLCAAEANNRQVFIVLDANNYIIEAYM